MLFSMDISVRPSSKHGWYQYASDYYLCCINKPNGQNYVDGEREILQCILYAQNTTLNTVVKVEHSIAGCGKLQNKGGKSKVYVVLIGEYLLPQQPFAI